MYYKQRIGRLGEDIACQYLQNQGYKIIERNFRCRQGEIDIIAKDEGKSELVFLEVKTRTSLKYGNAADAVDMEKQKHIKASAQYYIYKNRIKSLTIRIDVIEIYIQNNTYKLNHIKKIVGL